MNYKEIKFRAGIEVHRQLDTKKLFCNCPSLVNDISKADVLFERRLRFSQGELGNIDEAALFEFKKNKKFVYEASSLSSCLVEYDEEPPHNLNKEALQIALQVCKMLKAEIFDELQVMRKIVIDGSNVSSFQRTILLAVNGSLKTSKGLVKIQSICLEEEAAKKIQDELTFTKYRLDRLGIPLLEITTSPGLIDPEHVKETASLIGMILKSTGKVKSGIGSIRQDINLSVRNMARVEIKGFQDLRVMTKVIQNEISRLLSLKESKPEVRKINDDLTTSFLRPMPSSSRMYPETDILPIKITKEFLSKIKLPGLLSDKILELEKSGIEKSIAEEIIKEEIDFESYVKKYRNIEPRKLAEILINIPKEMKARFNLIVPFEHLEKSLELLNQSGISFKDIPDVLKDLKNKTFNIEKYRKLDISKIKDEILKIKKENPDLSNNALMGIMLKKYHGKINPKEVFDLLSK